MRKIIEEMNRCAAAGFHFPAIMVAVTIPDIASAVSAPSGTTTGALYRKWWDDYRPAKYLRKYSANSDPIDMLSSQELYAFRCALLHQGASHPSLHKGAPKLHDVVFIGPGLEENIHPSRIEAGCDHYVMLQVVDFCADITEAYEKWEAQACSDPHYAQNLARCITLHPNGLLPYVEGVPVIA